MNNAEFVQIAPPEPRCVKMEIARLSKVLGFWPSREVLSPKFKYRLKRTRERWDKTEAGIRAAKMFKEFQESGTNEIGSYESIGFCEQITMNNEKAINDRMEAVKEMVEMQNPGAKVERVTYGPALTEFDPETGVFTEFWGEIESEPQE